MRRTLVLLVAVLAAALASVTSAVTANARAPHTTKIVVRPVHPDGTPAAGYTVSNQNIPGLQCSGSSPSAVDNNIHYCYPSAAYTVSCWKSSMHTVLCLRDPQKKHLVRIHYSGTLGYPHKPTRPSPQSLTLFTGNYCLIRDGGAYPQVKGHPRWYAHYNCQHNGIYGRGDGINRDFNPWTVHVVNNVNNNTPNSIVIRHVKTAYYVGNA